LRKNDAVGEKGILFERGAEIRKGLFLGAGWQKRRVRRVKA